MASGKSRSLSVSEPLRKTPIIGEIEFQFDPSIVGKNTDGKRSIGMKAQLGLPFLNRNERFVVRKGIMNKKSHSFGKWAVWVR